MHDVRSIVAHENAQQVNEFSPKQILYKKTKLQRLTLISHLITYQRIVPSVCLGVVGGSIVQVVKMK